MTKIGHKARLAVFVLLSFHHCCISSVATHSISAMTLIISVKHLTMLKATPLNPPQNQPSSLSGPAHDITADSRKQRQPRISFPVAVC